MTVLPPVLPTLLTRVPRFSGSWGGRLVSSGSSDSLDSMDLVVSLFVVVFVGIVEYEWVEGEINRVNKGLFNKTRRD